MSLRSVNLNLIPILQALLRERSVAATAATLEMSPAAVSEALGRLRVLLDDPLLVRVGRSMKLTPKAAELIEPVNQMCDLAEGLLHFGEHFDPQRSRHPFKIACNDSLVFLTAPRILAAVHAVAPLAQVYFSDAGPDAIEKLSLREIDCLLMPRFFIQDVPASMPIRFRSVFKDQLVVIFSDRHPLAAKAVITNDDLVGFPQIFYNPVGVNLEGKREREVIGSVPFNVVVRVMQLTQIPHLVAQPPYVGWVPRSLAEHMKEQLHLHIHPAPGSLGDFNVCLAWSPVHHTDPAQVWFRELLVKVLSAPSQSG